MRAAEKSAVGPCGQPGLKTGSVSLCVKTFKRNLFLKRNFLQSFGVKRQMDVFGQCPFPRLGRQGIEKTGKCRGAENTAALNSDEQMPTVQLPPALRVTRAA